MKQPVPTEPNALNDQLVLLRLTAQQALLGAILPRLRAVSVVLDGYVVRWRATFDQEPDADEQELLSVAATEVIAAFPDEYLLEEEYLVVKPPEQPEHLALLVYKRHESA